MDSIVERWLATKSTNTRRGYAADMRQFQEYLAEITLEENTPPGLHQVAGYHVQTWLMDLKAEGLSPATINRKHAALRAFYAYATEQEGWERNPAAGIKSEPLSPYGRSRYPTAQQVQMLLEAIPEDTLQGKRDLAVLLGLFVLARRVTEWVSVHWRDLYQNSRGGWSFRYRAKGGAMSQQAIPGELWQVIEAYERAAGRWPLKPADPLFVAHSENGNRLPGVDHVPQASPLSAGYVRAVMRRYAVRAGIPVEVAHPHGLRHAGARMRRDNGASIVDLQKILSHSSITTTLIYTERVLDDPHDAAGDLVVSAVLPRALRLGKRQKSVA